MTSSHIIYIPLMILVGIVIGFVFGNRAAKDSAAMSVKLEQERRAAREARAARRAAKAAGGDASAGDADDPGGDGGEARA